MLFILMPNIVTNPCKPSDIILINSCIMIKRMIQVGQDWIPNCSWTHFTSQLTVGDTSNVPYLQKYLVSIRSQLSSKYMLVRIVEWHHLGTKHQLVSNFPSTLYYLQFEPFCFYMKSLYYFHLDFYSTLFLGLELHFRFWHKLFNFLHPHYLALCLLLLTLFFTTCTHYSFI